MRMDWCITTGEDFDNYRKNVATSSVTDSSKSNDKALKIYKNKTNKKIYSTCKV